MPAAYFLKNSLYTHFYNNWGISLWISFSSNEDLWHSWYSEQFLACKVLIEEIWFYIWNSWFWYWVCHRYYCTPVLSSIEENIDFKICVKDMIDFTLFLFTNLLNLKQWQLITINKKKNDWYRVQVLWKVMNWINLLLSEKINTTLLDCWKLNEFTTDWKQVLDY